MDSENKNIKMEIHIKVSILMVNQRGTVNIIGNQIIQFLREILKVAWGMEKEFGLKMEINMKANI